MGKELRDRPSLLKGEGGMTQGVFKTKLLTFTRLSLEAERKTSRWSVWNHHYGEKLGEIRWYAPWKQYCFFGGDLIFSRGCLEDIAQMLANLAQERLE